MKLRTAVFGVMMVCSVQAMAGSLYRWIDKDGNVHYGDMQPDKDVQDVEEKRFNSAAPQQDDDANLPYEARVARERFPVTLYVGENCGDPCKVAEAYLSKRKVPFSKKEIKTQEELNAFNKASGGSVMPTLSVGRQWIKGYQEAAWASELDTAGYPKGR